MGFRKDTIRLVLAPVCKQTELDDDDLLEEVNQAVEANKENKCKTKGCKSAASNRLEVESSRSVPAVAAPVHAAAGSDAILAKLDKLTGAVKELDVLKDTVRVLEGRLNSLVPGAGAAGFVLGQRQQPPRFVKCQPCQASGAYCRHCLNCGKEGHRQRDCPEPPKNT